MGNFLFRRNGGKKNDTNSDDDFTLDKEQPLNNFFIAVAKWKRRSSEELDIKKDDIMYLLEGSDSEWCRVRKHSDGVTGYVPKTFIVRLKLLKDEKWFADIWSTSEVEDELSGRKLPNGTFLIYRDLDEGNVLNYTLTVKDGRKVKHYEIKVHDGTFYIANTEIFRSLNQLVHHYKEQKDELCRKLGAPIPENIFSWKKKNRDSKENWKIPIEELELKERLGGGNFGDVHRGEWRGIVDIAIKTLKPGEIQVAAFRREAMIMKNLDHPNLVKLYGICEKGGLFYIIMEYLKNGSLLQYLIDNKNKISEKVMINMSAQIASGMKYLEEKEIIHRDLAARNVLVGGTFNNIPEVKVADFGLARELISGKTYKPQTEFHFPIRWTAPEALNDQRFILKSDVWSFGVLMCEIFNNGEEPYAGFSNEEIINLLNKGGRMEKPEECPQRVYDDVILKCWHEDPKERPTFARLYSDLSNWYAPKEDHYLKSDVK